jgi:hypothetical protein
MNVNKINREIVYGINVYTLSTTNKIPYQLTFERDLFFDRINVNLLPLIHPEKNRCIDLRNLVCDCFIEYLNENPDEIVYFEIDVSYREGELKMIKFLKWIENHKDDYSVSFEFTKTNAIQYMEVYIQKK